MRGLYEVTRAAVTVDGVTSDMFRTTMGVKQGCLLSPFLFSLMLNDLDEFLGGGVVVEGVLIRTLMYADDIALLADYPRVLQGMIDRLSEYCRMWNLCVNLDKSKVLVIRKGGRIGKSERWKYRGEDIEVVKRYKYLGVIVTSGLSMNEHMVERERLSKNSMNAVWKKVIGSESVCLSEKYRLFRAVFCSMFCYCSQVWGYGYADQVERLLRYFLKRVLRVAAEYTELCGVSRDGCTAYGVAYLRQPHEIYRKSPVPLQS